MEACVWSGQGTLGPPLGLTCLAEVVSLPGQSVPFGSLHSRAHLVGDVPSEAREERGVAGSGYPFILEDVFMHVILVAQTVNNLPAVQETWVQSLGQEDPLKKGTATRSSILAWRIPWTEEPGRLQSMGSQSIEHD